MAGAKQELIHTAFDTAYTWTYETQKEDLRRLYEKSKREQWNAAEVLDWKTSVDPEAENFPDAQIPVYGTHVWERLTKREILKLRREQMSWTLSQFMHGEQGALLATAQIVDAVPDIDAKFYAAQQVADEARHVEVYAKYLGEKLQREYPCNPHLKGLLDAILTDSRWDMKYLGMQILVEGLALAAFAFLHNMASEPLIKDITYRIMQDEARHVAFGVLTLQDLYKGMGASDLKDREDFTYESCRLMRDRLLAVEVWEEMGWDVPEVEKIVLDSPSLAEFRKLLFSKIVPNVKRLGLLTPRLRAGFEELGIIRFEEYEPSA